MYVMKDVQTVMGYQKIHVLNVIIIINIIIKKKKKIMKVLNVTKVI